jgi:CRP-like cAMP-binding protein
MYILVHGEAVLVFRDAHGNDIVFSRAAAGEIFAITEAFSSRPLKFGLVAMSECEAGVIERHEFESFMSRNRFPRERLIRELSKNVQASEKHLRIFAR